MRIQHFFDSDTYTLTYIVFDENTLDAVIIDPVLNFDASSGNIHTRSILEILNFVASHQLKVKGILETHAHADHLSGAQELKKKYPSAPICIGEKIQEVQNVFKDVFCLKDLNTNGSQFDYLFSAFEERSFGSLKMRAIPSPGHTPACMSYLFEDALFTGDALFMPDYGTGRCDFPKGCAQILYHSITKNIYSLPESVRVFVGHDYSPNGREMKFQTTIKESKDKNIQLNGDTKENDFVEFRQKRDKTLKTPMLLLPSIQVNIDGGKLPKKEENGVSYLKIPLNLNGY